MDPLFSMYSGMMDSCALAARQQWGSQGIWIPEITFFDGMEKLPDDIAARTPGPDALAQTSFEPALR